MILLDFKIFAGISGIKFYLIVIIFCVILLTKEVVCVYVCVFIYYVNSLFLSSVHTSIRFGLFLLFCRISS